MTVTTTHIIPNREIEHILGIARGSTARAKHIGNDFIAGLKNIVGGEIEEYTRLQADSREQAMQRMIKDAERLGTDTIVGMAFATSVITRGAAEILVYGTVVKLR